MKYVITIELERRNRHAAEDIKERFEQLLLPENAPKTISEFHRIVGPLIATNIQVRPDYSQLTGSD